MTAPTLVQSVANQSGGSGITLTWPGTPASGNLLVTAIVKRSGSSGQTLTVTSSGWTLLDVMSVGNGTTDNSPLVWYYKFAGGSESTSIVWTCADGSNPVRACAAEFAGVNTFDSKATAKTLQGAATTHTTNAVTPTEGRPLVLVGVIAKDVNGESFLTTPTPSFTTLDSGQIGINNPQYIVGYRLLDPSSGSYTMTSTEVRNASVWAGNIAAWIGDAAPQLPKSIGYVIA